MPNHYHLLIKQKTEIPVYQSINAIWASYSRYYNKKYGRRGSIFSGKLQHNAVQDGRYLLQLCVYIHRNPLEAGLVKNLSDWQWTNFPEWVGVRQGSLLCDEVREMYFKSVGDYIKFMNEYRDDAAGSNESSFKF